MNYQFCSVIQGFGHSGCLHFSKENKANSGVYGKFSALIPAPPYAIEVGKQSKVWVLPSRGEIGAPLCLNPSAQSGIIRSSQPDHTGV
jgi:hypothetical protein